MRIGKKRTIVKIGELLEHRIEGNKVLLRGQGGSLEVSSPADQVVRVRSGLNGRFGEDRSFAVAEREGKIPPQLSENAERVELDFSGLKLTLSKNPALMTAYGREGELLFREHPWFNLAWTDKGLALSHLIEYGAHYFGFGEKTGPLNKLNQAMKMWNTDMPYHGKYDPLYITIPFTLVLCNGRCHGLFFDNPSRSHFQVGSSMEGSFNYRVESGELDLYLIGGPAVREVVRRFTDLTGRLPMPPRWSLGHQQSRWSYMNEAEVMEIARNFRERDIPTDVIYLDIHYMDRYRVFTFNEKRFPDPGKMTEKLGEQGFKVVAAVDPGVAAAEDYFLYREGREKDYFCRNESGGEYHSRVWPGKVAFPDFSKNEVRKWWGDSHKTLTDAGVAGVWNDMNEPSCWTVDVRARDAVLALRPVRHPRMVHDDDGRNTPHLGFRNVYGLCEDQGAYEGLLRLRPDTRPFILSRSGYAGVQRYAAVWTGDNSSTFAQLRLSIPMLLNLGLSGVPFIGPDIGGFMWNCTPELYARWIELGAFYPMCRTHCAIKMRRQEPWSFGPRVERIARDYLKLRYRLHPTLYSLLWESHETGAPVLRPLFYEFQDEPATIGVEDECMFGPWVLLAPVMEKGRTKRSVFLPDALWTDFWTGEKIRGPKMIERDAPLELMPIYVRAGAALFMWPALSWLDQRPVDRLVIELYPPERGATESVLYEDDGETLQYREGLFAKRRVVLEAREDGYAVRVMAKEGPFDPPPRELVLKLLLPRRPASANLDGNELSIGAPGCEYVMTDRILKIAMSDDQKAHEILCKLATE